VHCVLDEEGVLKDEMTPVRLGKLSAEKVHDTLLLLLCGAGLYERHKLLLPTLPCSSERRVKRSQRRQALVRDLFAPSVSDLKLPTTEIVDLNSQLKRPNPNDVAGYDPSLSTGRDNLTRYPHSVMRAKIT
jgi:hypothetical protein